MAWVCDASVPFDGRRADFVREDWLFRIVVVFLMQELCGNSPETTIVGTAVHLRGLLLLERDLDYYPGRHNPQAHIDRLGRVRQQADGNEIHTRFGIGADIFQMDSS